MSNSNEKLIAALVSLVPLARDAYDHGNMSKQVSAVLSNGKIRHASSKMAHQAEDYIRARLNSNNFTRQLSKQFAPRRSNLPAIALAVVGVGFVWSYLAARNRRKIIAEGGAVDPIPEGGRGSPITLNPSVITGN